MKKESIMKFVKAAAAVLACAGIFVSPESQEAIVGGFLGVYAVFSAIQGKFKVDENK